MTDMTTEQFLQMKAELNKLAPTLLEQREDGRYYGTEAGVVTLNEMLASKGFPMRAALDVNGRYEYHEIDIE